MAALVFLIYVAIGCGAGWALQTYLAQPLPLSIGGGTLVTLLLGQLHLMATRSGNASEDVAAKLETVQKTITDVERRMSVTEARTEAVEVTVKHEFTERRDSLVNEIRQLEGLIAQLSQNFETATVEAPKQNGAYLPDDATLKAVRDALKHGRVDLHLQPIVSLPQRRVAYYEGFARLRDENGSLILPADFLDAARRANLIGIIDTMTLFRCVQIVRRLAERDRRVGVFCNISAASLEDDQYFPEFLTFMQDNQDLAGALIFEIRADRFEVRSRKIRERMDTLIGLGFRFSIDHAPNLLIDLPRLQDAGIRFVKMNGNTLLSELKDPEGPRPVCSIQRRLDGEDVSAVFSRYGVTLIAEKMEDEASVIEILSYDIPFGQGNIFGAPRPIKSSLMEETAPPEEFVRRLSMRG